MAKINGVALTEKGVVKTAVRTGIVEKEMKAFENAMVGYERAEKGAVMFKTYEDKNGNIIYATYTLTVSTSNPNAEKSKATKKVAKEPETFEIEE